MKIPQAIDFFENLLRNASSKAETKTCQAFLKVLNNLNAREWSDQDLQKLDGKLLELELNAQTANRKKHLRKQYAALTTFLMKEFSLITTGYYTTQGMIFGMIFGQGLGMAVGVAFDPALGIALGLSIGTGMGMALGIAFGAMKDAEAKKQGRELG